MEKSSKIKYFKGFWKVEDVRKNPNWLFVFGDNDIGVGIGGQAIIRNQVNVCGIPTKKSPSNHPSAFYTDNELEQNKQKISRAISKLVVLSRNYEYIILPEDGLGTGLADLPRKAPLTYQFLISQMKMLCDEI
jgi:hypothetical protein